MKDENIDVRKMIQAAKNGDKEAFSFIYTHFYSPIYRYIYARMKDVEDAEDMAQEVFLKAYRSLDSFSLQETSPLAYFYTIARNTLIDYRRKKRVASSQDDVALDQARDADPNPEEKAARQQESKELYEYIEFLTDEQREAVVLKYISGLSNKEIADIMGKHEDAVRQLQTRGLRALRELYNKKHGQS